MTPPITSTSSLRVLAAHPTSGLSNSKFPTEDMIKLAQELELDVIARIKESTGTEEPYGLECPVCMGKCPRLGAFNST